jgi:uncharacterized membrane protein
VKRSDVVRSISTFASKLTDFSSYNKLKEHWSSGSWRELKNVRSKWESAWRDRKHYGSKLKDYLSSDLWSDLKSYWPTIAPTGIWLAAAVIASMVLAFMHSPIAPVPGVITMLLLPGAWVMSMLRARPVTTAGRLVLAVCLSMSVVMLVGFAASVVGPALGVAQPLDVLPQSIIWLVIIMVILKSSARRGLDPVTWILEGVDVPQVAHLLAGGLLAVVSILGVAQLNHTGNTELATFGTVLDVAVLLAGVVGGWNKKSRWPLSTLLYSASFAFLLSTSLRGGHLYGWDVQQEFGVAWNTLHGGVWHVPANHDPYASMLSLTVLPAILHSVAKLRLLAFFQIVVPAILALLPVAVFSTVRGVPRWITSGRSAPRPGLALAVVGGLVVSSVAFSSELVSITRQAMALTMLAALVMVIFDRSILKRPAQITIGILVVSISFTHYTTSYLVAGVFLCAWPVGLVWSNGWLGTPKSRVVRHRHDVRSRNIICGTLVALAFVSAFGWNLAVTRNSALTAPSSAVSASGVGFGQSTLSALLPPAQMQLLLSQELKRTAKYLIPVKGSRSVHLAAATIPTTRGVIPAVGGLWNEICFLAVESLWVVLGLSLLYGVLRLGRRKSYEYSSDLVGLAVTGLAFGAFLRFSGTLASFYNPERAAIITAILLAPSVTLYLDDLAVRLHYLSRTWSPKARRASFGAGFVFLAVLVVHASGLGAVFFGGTAPGSLSTSDANVQDFGVSTPEWATAVWLRNNVRYPGIVQSDLYAHLVLLSEPGSYDLLDEILPRVVDRSAYVYLSAANLQNRVMQADADNLTYFSVYRSTLAFFDNNFYVVYSTGGTRVYH